MNVRMCKLGDLPRVIQIERTCFGPESYSVTTFLAHVFRDRKGLLIIENDEDRIVGYILARVGLRWLGIHRGGITSIAVDPTCRRCGAGTALLSAALDYLRNSGVEEADLEVNVRNRAAQSLYESFGFVQARLLPDYYGPGADGLKMTVDLRDAAASGRRAHPSGAHRFPHA